MKQWLDNFRPWTLTERHLWSEWSECGHLTPEVALDDPPFVRQSHKVLLRFSCTIALSFFVLNFRVSNACGSQSVRQCGMLI